MTVFIEFNIVPQKQKQKPRQIPLYRKANWDTIKSELVCFYNSFKTDMSSDTNERWEKFKNKLNSLVQLHIPHKTAKQKVNKPWVNHEIRQLIKKRDRLHKKGN